MNTAARPRLESAIRERLAPVLRQDGFAGSGRSFRRAVGGWIHVLNVQGSRYGGQFAVNLALQPISVPDVLGNMPDPRKISEELCEFRRRMPKSFERQDHWWTHDSTSESMDAAVRDAAETYSKIGRALLADVTSKISELNTVSPSAFAAGTFNFLGFGSTQSRMALVLARMRRTQGLEADARAFAMYALEQAGSATLLKQQIQAMLEGHDA